MQAPANKAPDLRLCLLTLPPCAPRPPWCLQEQAYQRMTEAKKEKWEKNNTFYSNRGLSRDIRKVGGLWMGEWMDGWMGGWVDGWVDGWI